MIKQFYEQYKDMINVYSKYSATERQNETKKALTAMQSGNRNEFVRVLALNYAMFYKLLVERFYGFAEGNTCDNEIVEMYFCEKLYSVLMRYDYTKERSLSTFIYSSMKADSRIVTDGLHNNALYMPVHVNSAVRAVYYRYNELRAGGLKANEAVNIIAKERDITVQQVRDYLRYRFESTNTVSFNTPFEDSDTMYSDIIDTHDTTADIARNYENQQVLNAIVTACKKKFSSRDCDIFFTHTNLFGDYEYTFQDLAAKYGITKQRVDQIYRRVLHYVQQFVRLNKYI